MKRSGIAGLLAAALLIGGCATSFTGSAYVSDGVDGCTEKCKGWGLEFAGMVALGEYSDACICQKPGKKVSKQAVAAAGAAAVGVVVREREREEQRRRDE